MFALPLQGFGAEQDAEKKALALMEQGIRQYQKGQYEQATATFNDLVAMRPDSPLALKLRQEVDVALLARMTGAEDEQLSQSAEKILELMTQAVRATKREVSDPAAMQSGLRSPDLDEYLDARATALAHGSYAVPYLLPLLTEEGAEAQKIVGRTLSTLVDIGRPAALPLIAALESKDNVLRVRAASVLSQVGNQRAVAPLMAVRESEDASQTLQDAATDAVETITEKSAGQLGSARVQYAELIKAYLREDAGRLGYVFGNWADVWDWDPDAKKLEDRLTHVRVPAVLYYQRQGAAFALQALEATPGDRRLQSLLPAALARELELARLHSAEGQDGEVIAQINERLAELKQKVPVVCHLYEAQIIGDALRQVMEVDDASASFYLITSLSKKVGVVPGDASQALDAASHFKGKEPRYRAAIELMRASPRGFVPNPNHVMQVMSAAIKRAAQRTALIVSNDLQMRNKLRTVLEQEGLSSVEANSDAGSISQALNLQPSIDVVFLNANAPQNVFNSAYQKIIRDGRTGGEALYVIRNPRKPAPDLEGLQNITGIMSPDDIRSEPINKMLEEAQQRRRVLASPERAETVLMAARALQKVDPSATRYPLSVAEPALIDVLGTYEEKVTVAAVKNLARFGSFRTLEPLAKTAGAEESSPTLKSAACRALAAVIERNPGNPPEPVLAVLWTELKSPDQPVREAAAEALSVSGVPRSEILSAAREVLTTSAGSGTE
jgi:HEAT repeat protein